MRESYSQDALNVLLASVSTRRGWDFSGINVLRQPVPWEYHDVVPGYLRSSDAVLDVGTGAGERLRALSETFDVILDRHAPFDLTAIAAHLRPGGYLITQQVGEMNMACVKAALG